MEETLTTGHGPVAEGRGGGRERLLGEARARFVANGYADVTMQEIADAVGLTKAAAYYHFGDKEGLFEQVFEQELERICRGMDAEIERSRTFREQLEAVALFLLEAGIVDFGRLMKDFERYVSEERRRGILERTPSPFGVMRPAFERALAGDQIRSVNLDVTISLYLAMVFGQIRSATYRRAALAPPAEVAGAIAEMVLRGIGASRGVDEG